MQAEYFHNKLIINPGKPFEKDYTGKMEEIAKAYSHIIESEAASKPLVVFLDAPWGVGKTTFIDMWGQSLINSGQLAIKFDAWKSDHSDNPLLEIISQLLAQLKHSNCNEEIVKELKQTGAAICKMFATSTLKLISKIALRKIGIDNELTTEFFENLETPDDQSLSSNYELAMEEYEDKIRIMDNFKKTLQKISSDSTMYIFIDELDRCTPTFALSVLEKIKHIFDIENIVCVISTNIKMLAKSVGSIYGHDDVSAKDYLERFMDFTFKLPEPDREAYIRNEFQDIKNTMADHEFNKLLDIILICSNSLQFSTRLMQKFFKEVRIFLRTNDSLNGSKKIPIIFYQSVICTIATRRCNDKELRSILVDKLEKNNNSTKIHNTYINSSSPFSLLQYCNNLLRELIHLFKSSDHRLRNAEQIKQINESRNILEKIINEIYGGSQPKLIDILNFGDDKYLLQSLNNYVNHFENGERIISFLETATDN